LCEQPQAPPQQPPPARGVGAMGSVEVNSPAPIAANDETCTRVRVDSQDGQVWDRSRSAKEVSTSNRRSQASQRYS